MLHSPYHLFLSFHRYLHRKARNKSASHTIYHIVKGTWLFSKWTSSVPISSSKKFSHLASLHKQQHVQDLRLIFYSYSTTNYSTKLTCCYKRSSSSSSYYSTKFLIRHQQNRTISYFTSSSSTSSVATATTIASNPNNNHTITNIFNPTQLFSTTSTGATARSSSNSSSTHSNNLYNNMCTSSSPSTTNQSNLRPWYFQRQQEQQELQQNNTIFNDQSSNQFSKLNNNKNEEEEGEGEEEEEEVGVEGRESKQSYRPPSIRGMMDLMESNHHVGSLVYRGQQRKSNPNSKQQKVKNQQQKGEKREEENQIKMSFLKEDDLSLKTNKRNQSILNKNKNEQKTIIQWYISIPMNILSFIPSTATSESSESSSTLTSSASTMNDKINLNEISLLDPLWLMSFNIWGQHVRHHFTNVMIFIQKLMIESQKQHLDFQMMMQSTEICIYLPSCLCYPIHNNMESINQWILRHIIMKNPPYFEIKSINKNKNNNDDNNDEKLEKERTVQENHHQNHHDTIYSHHNDNIKVVKQEKEMNNNQNPIVDDDDIVIVDLNEHEKKVSSSMITNHPTHSSTNIGPRYFEGIHTFLNHVDSMIDSSPAFSQRRFSA